MKRRFALRAYGAALWLLPGEFRRRYGDDLLRVQQRLLRAARARGLGTYAGCLARGLVDVVRTAVALRARDRAARRTERRLRRMTGVMTELKASWRSVLRAPSFTTAAVVTLGAGVGCAGAAFAVLHGMLLQPLPHAGGEQLVMMWQQLAEPPIQRGPVSYPLLEDMRVAVRGEASIEAYAAGASALLHGESDVEQVSGARVTGGLLTLLGNRPQLGRVLLPADDLPAADPVVVLSHRLWLRRFGGQADVLERTMLVNGTMYRIVGVMGAEMVFPSARAEFWVPLRIVPEQRPRDLNFLTAIARLRPGITLETAQRDFTLAYERLRVLYPSDLAGRRIQLEPRREFLVGAAARPVLLAAAASLVLLLIAGANVSNLFLVRGAGRTRDIVIRRALGAGRARVVRGLVFDGAIVGLLATAVGILLAYLTLRLVLELGPDTLPRRAELRLDLPVLTVMTTAAFAVATIASLVQLIPARLPAGQLSTRELTPARGARSLQHGLVVSQVALTLVLVVAAALLTSTMTRLLAVPVGFAGERVLTAWVSLPPSRYDSPARIGVFYDNLFARIASLPGVESVSGTWALPFSEDYASGSFVAADTPDREPITVSSAPIRGPYFETIGMRVLDGRSFYPTDDQDAPAVVVINQTLATRLWPTGGAVGRYLVDPDDPADRVQVVGVVNDVKRRTLLEPAEPELYQPHAQAGWTGGSLYVTVRTAAHATALTPAIRAALRALDPNLPLMRVATLDERVRASVTTQRFRAGIVNAVGSIALLLSLLGLAAVQAIYVAAHQRELAVRLALGARPEELVRELTLRGVRLAAAGMVLGVAGALIVLRALESLLFELSPTDPASYALTIVAFLLVSALASWLPVRRASRVQPGVLLRYD